MRQRRSTCRLCYREGRLCYRQECRTHAKDVCAAFSGGGKVLGVGLDAILNGDLGYPGRDRSVEHVLHTRRLDVDFLGRPSVTDARPRP